MANYRAARVNDATAQALSVIIRDVKDPRISGNFVSITGAEVSPDLKYAKIYWSALHADRDSEKEITKGLKSASGFLRRRLAEELNLRITPELNFCVDRSAANSAHISALLRTVETAAPAESSAAASSAAAAESADKADKENGEQN